MRKIVLYIVGMLLCGSGAPGQGAAGAPVFKVEPVESAIKFGVEASVKIGGTFDKWDASLKFPSRDVTTGTLVVKIQAGSVNTGSGMKDNKLKGKDFFYAAQNPLITFVSKKVTQTGRRVLRCRGILRFAG